MPRKDLPSAEAEPSVIKEWDDAGMTQEYEYVAVAPTPGSLRKGYDQKLTEALNEVAQHGWRLRFIMEAPAGGHMIFERPKQ